MKYTMFSIVAILAIAIMLPVHAETFDVVINVDSNTNTCVPNCVQPELLKINPGDTVRWVNMEFCDEAVEATWPACSRNYSIIDGNPIDGSTGTFDLGTIIPGETKSWIFNTEGQFDYFDPGHPWVQGSIVVGSIVIEKEIQVTKEVEVEVEIVLENGTATTIIETEIVTTTEIEVVEVEPELFTQKPERPIINDAILESLYPDRVSDIKTFINVGLNVNADDVHTVNYIFHEAIGNSQINMEDSGNTLGFSFKEPTTGSLVLKMPNALIGETLAVIADGDRILEHTYTQQGEFSIVEVQINEPTRVLTFEATYVTPEYLSIAILGAVIATVIGIGVYSTRKQPALLIKA